LLSNLFLTSGFQHQPDGCASKGILLPNGVF